TQQWEVIGFTSDRSFQATPVVFFDQDALVTSSASGVSTAPNVAVSRTDLTADASLTAVGLQALSLSELISELPGYSAQVLTFSLMIVSLIAISSFVLGIFVYVLTLQKRSVLGVLKARGVSTRYLIASGAAQTGLLAAGGVLIGLALTVGTSLFLPGAVPFRSDGVTDGVIGVAFMVFSLIGGVISVRVIARIDPVEAIA
ncbi:MAG TPA: ABC transporter permease, partial [Pseudoclavibacter sp.]|nr:ABC transporter permease [Pseudoclavibacter sp.]